MLFNPVCIRKRPGALKKWPGLLLVLYLLTGCAIQNAEPLSESFVLTVSQPEFVLKQGDHFYWRSDLVYLYKDARKQPPDDIRPYLKQEIQTYLTQGGYHFTEQPEEARYGLVAVVVLGDGLTAREVLDTFGLKPAFQSSRQYEKGTIVVAMFDAQTEKVMWRGALQANVDLELAAEVRLSRVKEAVRRLFRRLPN